VDSENCRIPELFPLLNRCISYLGLLQRLVFAVNLLQNPPEMLFGAVFTVK
jgi:hypothetical protein